MASNQLHIFGDSFSESRWPHIISKEANFTLRMNAKGGCTNEDILHCIVSSISSFEDNDIIVIQLSGQGRLNVKDRVVYGDWIDQHKIPGFKSDETRIITDWYNTFFLPSIVKKDRNVNSIIKLANYLSSKYKVILWNLTSLGDVNVTNHLHNDNVATSPNITYSDLWHPLSEGGRKGWVEIIYERGFNKSEQDLHPTGKGDKFIANQILHAINIKKTLI